MTLRILLVFPIMMALATPAPAVETPAALAICDTCVTDSDFANQALFVPVPYQTIYVSNRSDTLKFDRRIFLDEFAFGGPRLEVEVIPVTISSLVRTALGDLIDLSQRDDVTVPRDLLETPRNSVVGDLQNARLDVSFLQNLRQYLNSEGYAGRPSDFEVGGGFSIGFISINATEKEKLRTKPLLVKVTYPDGSLVQLTIGPEIIEWLDVSLKDAAGNDIPVEDFQDIASPVDASLLDGRELTFDPSNPGFVENFLDALRTRPTGTGLVCESFAVGPSRIVVSCRVTQ